MVLGAGFAGLAAAKGLSDVADVTLVDRHNYQTFMPLLYQVATAGLAADQVAYPVRGALRKTGITFRMGSPISIDHAKKEVTLNSHDVLPFDHLVVAFGSATADFGVKGVAEIALGMKSVAEAIGIRTEVMRRFEDLCRSQDGARLSISVVGGGPTGVELSGALAELVRGPLTSDEAEAAKRIDIRLIEAGSSLLPSFSAPIPRKTKSDLERLGINVLLNTAVEEITSSNIVLKDGRSLPSELTVWTAGVQGEPAARELGLPMNRGRIEVEPTLRIKNFPNYWAIGDIAGAMGKKGKPLPMVAPVAMQEGAFIAKQISRAIEGKELLEFHYKDKGSMATIGRQKAVVEIGKFKLTGALAWFVWLFLHLFYLLGGRNKVLTMTDWIWNYLTFDRGNRHIMDSH